MMKTKKIWIRLVLFLSLAFVLAGCGGGGGNGPSAGSGDFVRLDKFSLAPAQLTVGPGPTDGTNFTVDWGASYASPSNLYTFELHFTKDPAALSDDTRVFSLNCPLHPSCNKTAGVGSQPCVYLPFSNDLTSGNATVSCQSVSAKKTVKREGETFAVGRACIFNSQLELVCSEGTQKITLG